MIQVRSEASLDLELFKVKTEKRTRALELAIDSYERLEEPQVATTSEILDRARMFSAFIMPEQREE